MRVPGFRRFVSIGASMAFLVLVVPACSDDDGGACDDVVDPCTAEGTTSCVGATVQTCEADADGCLTWTNTETCATGFVCSQGACECDDACAAGANQCAGDVVQLCEANQDGCLVWADDVDCTDTGQVCDDTAAATCVEGAGCGNDVIEGTELCDGTDLGSETCVDQGYGGGTLACNATCDGYVTTGCDPCGNDQLDGTELCDGIELDGETCVDQGFGGGTLACNATCDGYVTTGCTPALTCGNAQLDGTEVCDGTELDGETCISQGFYSGSLACASNCGSFVTTGCSGYCGDTTRNGTEECDTADFGTATCGDYGFYSGSLTCDSSCVIDSSGCSEECGDSIRNGAEVCDGADFGTATCADYGHTGGTLACNATCDTIDSSGCFSPRTIGWCNLQWPTGISAAEGTTEMIYGRLYIAGLTDTTTGPDTDALVIAQAGYGPDGVDPTVDATSWTWFTAAANGSFTDASNDEYMVDVTLPPAAGSPYDFAYRFSGDGGATWTYCDLDTTANFPVYDLSDTGAMATTQALGTLIFSEYVEGSSNNKALEVYNASTAPIQLDDCQILRYNNGSPTPTSTYTFSATALAVDSTFVVCHSSADAALAPYCDDLTANPTAFNGDDSLELWCGGLMVDSIGQTGVDPGNFWGTAPITTLDHTLRRNAGIIFGDIDSSNAYDPAAEWQSFAIDTFDGLGIR
ncbi:MAG: lamin tail domain-containing protein [bacterium]